MADELGKRLAWFERKTVTASFADRARKVLGQKMPGGTVLISASIEC